MDRIVAGAEMWRLAGYGDDSKLRERLEAADREYVLLVGEAASVFASETVFVVPERNGATAAAGFAQRANR